ncbi:HdeD family acid-resistance protein [Naasia lichenicola]|uniref:DUF308 domain-containing protein n=1 Tax=Naasia lichenicola TaxID=2565933 RepID=A0A4S4FJX0_9MICO|nr:DUF308 domain-containing protein [Naasia lichenicola]THG29565.1 DUF308 domain-containing protein [Naasia lichenicola]
MSILPSNSPLAVSIPGLRKVHRGQTIALAVIGVLLGLIGFFYPGATLLTVAIVFGSYLVAAGLFRIVASIIADNFLPAMRVISALMGLLTIAVGVLVLADPFTSLVVLAVFIGIGWIIDGIVDLVAGVRGAIRPRWFGFVSGVVSIAAGVVMFVLPIAGVGALVQIGSIFLIVVSVTTLLTLPRRTKTA